MIAIALAVFVARADRLVASDATDSVPEIRIEMGEVTVRDTDNRFYVRDLELDYCGTRPQAADTPVPKAPVAADQIVLDVVVRHHRTERITISAIDPGYAWIAPCVQRALFTPWWPIRSGRLEVPITVVRPTEREAQPVGAARPSPC